VEGLTVERKSKEKRTSAGDESTHSVYPNSGTSRRQRPTAK